LRPLWDDLVRGCIRGTKHRPWTVFSNNISESLAVHQDIIHRVATLAKSYDFKNIREEAEVDIRLVYRIFS